MQKVIIFQSLLNLAKKTGGPVAVQFSFQMVTEKTYRTYKEQFYKKPLNNTFLLMMNLTGKLKPVSSFREMWCKNWQN